MGKPMKRGSKWCFVLELGKDPQTGKRNQKWISGFKTKKEAEKAQIEMQSQINKGEFVDSTMQTLPDFLDTWIENQSTKVSEKTYLNYKRYITNHIEPHFKKMPIQELKPFHIETFYTSLIKKGLSPSTIKYIHSILASALEKAIVWQIIKSNPASLAEKPKLIKKDIHVLSEAHIKEVLTELENTPYYIPVYIAISTGMRKGEICGLKWSDIDLDKGTLSVQRTRQKVNGEIKILPTKTDSSNRSVSLSSETVKILKKHKSWIAQNKLVVGSSYIDTDFVCVREDGEPLHPEYVSAKFIRLTNKMGLNVRFHDLRHTHATLLLKGKVNPRIVQERLGHSNISITLGIYSHVLPDMQKEAAEKLDEVLFGS